jgi:phage-related protein
MKRRISWVGRSLKDFRTFPVAVQDQMTFALRLAASGATPDNAKP